jgi:hypothetical protein
MKSKTLSFGVQVKVRTLVWINNSLYKFKVSTYNQYYGLVPSG